MLEPGLPEGGQDMEGAGSRAGRSRTHPVTFFTSTCAHLKHSPSSGTSNTAPLLAQLAYTQPPTQVPAISICLTCSGWQLRLPGLCLSCFFPTFQTLCILQGQFPSQLRG